MDYYLAIDIGATSGRAILGHYENNELKLEEIYRFNDYLKSSEKGLFWDLNKLFKEIINSLKIAKNIGKIPTSMGIDSFGVDYCLLDKNDNLVRDTYSYRDNRTVKSGKALDKILSKKELYLKTGVYPQLINTIYQLYDDKLNGYLNDTKSIMFLPCYLSYLLTGIKYNELSIASTSGLLSINNSDYDEEILDILGISKNVFPKFKNNGDLLGNLKKNIVEEVGFDLQVKSILAHDTGTGVFGSNIKNNELFLSSGTWSLIGCLCSDFHCTNKEFDSGFTNELNGKHEVRFLKNIVGMHIVNSVNNEQKNVLKIQDVVKLAESGTNYKEIFDPTLYDFLAPDSMEKAIISNLKKNKKPLPQNLSELYFCIYNSLANCYKKTIKDISKCLDMKFTSITIFGGGSKNHFLNKLTSDLTGLKVIVGPSEATSIGNIMCQCIKS